MLQVLLNDATLTSSAQSSSTARYIPNTYSSLLQVLIKVFNLRFYNLLGPVHTTYRIIHGLSPFNSHAKSCVFDATHEPRNQPRACPPWSPARRQFTWSPALNLIHRPHTARLDVNNPPRGNALSCYGWMVRSRRRRGIKRHQRSTTRSSRLRPGRLRSSFIPPSPEVHTTRRSLYSVRSAAWPTSVLYDHEAKDETCYTSPKRSKCPPSRWRPAD